MTTYSFSISPTFGSEQDISNLQTQINNNISTTLTSLIVDSGSLNITFANSLSSGDANTLNNLVSSANQTQQLGNSQLAFSCSQPNVTSTNYVVQMTIIFPGTSYISNITNIQVVSYMNKGTSYTIRLFDALNDNVIASGTFTNTANAINELTNINNLPNTQSIFELQCKVDTNTSASVKNLTIFYNK